MVATHGSPLEIPVPALVLLLLLLVVVFWALDDHEHDQNVPSPQRGYGIGLVQHASLGTRQIHTAGRSDDHSFRNNNQSATPLFLVRSIPDGQHQ